MARKQGTPLWITLGCGCVLLVGLVIGGVVAAGYLGVSAFQGYVEDMKDPASRSARAGEILGASQLPEGYTALLFLRIPWVFDMAILSDGDPQVFAEEDDVDLDSASLGDHVFLFFKLRKKGMDDEDVDRMLRGEGTADGVHADVGIELEPDQELARGAFDIEPQRLRYVAYRGEIELDDDLPGIYSRVIIDCPTDDLTRVAVWFKRDPEEPDREATPGFTGTPADEATLRQLMGHFDVCVD